MKKLLIITVVSCWLFNSLAIESMDSLQFIKLKSLQLENDIWNEKDSSKRNFLILSKAKYLKSYKLFKESLSELYRIEKDTYLKYEISYEKSFNYYLLNDSYSAYNEISSIPDSVLKLNNNFLLLFLILQIETNQWNQCKDKLLEFSPSNEIREQIASLPVYSEPYSTEKAFKLSKYFPGLGQFYSKHYQKGLTSFLLCSGTIAFSAFLVYSGLYVSATIIGTATFVKFYSGGQQNSIFLAKSRNSLSLNQIKEEYFKTIFIVVDSL